MLKNAYDAYLDDIRNNNEVKQIEFPFKINKIDYEVNQKLLKNFTGERTGFVQVGPKKYFFPSGYEHEAQNYYNFQSRPGDVWVATYPRSGTTWTQEMVWLLENNLDFDRAAEVPLTKRFPFFEFSIFFHKEAMAEYLHENSSDTEKYEMVQNIAEPVWKMLSLTEGPRYIKTHLPFSLLPPNLLDVGCKVIYVARHPKDVAVSFYHLNRLIRTQGYIGNFSKYWQYFQNNLQPWSPYWEHLQEGWERRNEKNVLFLFYEELSKDLRSGIEKVSKFLGKNYSVEQLNRLEEHLRFENFKYNKSVNSNELKNVGLLNDGEQGFVRKGTSGGWKDYFTEELNEQADAWIEENLLKTDMRFPTM